MIPILLNHDHSRVIGTVHQADGRLFVEFTADVPVTQELFLEMFGNPGARVLESEEKDGVTLIRKAEILEFSFSPIVART
jgi:hypothetical protein